MRLAWRSASVAALVTMAVLTPALRAGEKDPLPAGTTAPAFTLSNLAGESVSLESLRGKVVVIDFWATWCGPCRRALPHTQELANSEAARAGDLVVLTSSYEKKDVVQKFVEDNGYTFPVLLDPKTEVRKLYNVIAIPTFYVIGRDGVIAYSKINPTAAALDEAVAAALEAEAPAP